MLNVGDKVKYKEVFLECWKGKERSFSVGRRGVLTKVNGMGGVVLWENENNEYESRQFIPDLETT